MTNTPDRTRWYIEEIEKLGFEPDAALDGWTLWGRGVVAHVYVHAWLDGGAVVLRLLRGRKIGSSLAPVFEFEVDTLRTMSGCSVEEVRAAAVSLASYVR